MQLLIQVNAPVVRHARKSVPHYLSKLKTGKTLSMLKHRFTSGPHNEVELSSKMLVKGIKEKWNKENFAVKIAEALKNKYVTTI